jgi:two-component system chemotaxis response regulator CheY
MGKTIMTVDDSASMRQMVSFTLKRAGHDVIEACDGKDALNKLTGSSVQMIITDLNMPNMDGFMFIKAVRASPQFRCVPIIMLTTESQGDKVREGKAAGATGWIVKPFNADDLLGVIKKVLGC